MIYSPFDFWNVCSGIFYQNRTNVSILFVDLPIITIYAKNRQKVTLVNYVVCIEMFQYIMLLLMCIQFELSFFNGDFI